MCTSPMAISTPSAGIDLEVAVGECVGILGPERRGEDHHPRDDRGPAQARPRRHPSLRRAGVAPQSRLLLRIGVQLQASAFFDRLTVIEQLHTFADLYGAPRSRAVDLLELVSLADRVDRADRQAVGGPAATPLDRLRARCTIPALLFLDEPSAGLDPTSAPRPVGPGRARSAPVDARWCCPPTSWTRPRRCATGSRSWTRARCWPPTPPRRSSARSMRPPGCCSLRGVLGGRRRRSSRRRRGRARRRGADAHHQDAGDRVGCVGGA